MTSSAEIQLEAWPTNQCPSRVEYSRPLIEELCLAAIEGYHRLARGGIEIGGILFGVRDSGSIQIAAHRALECEHAFGPSFKLSDNDRLKLEALLASAATDGELEDMEVVGWYHSHTRSEVFLAEKDVELFQRYFPEPWQIALVLRPNRFDPVRVGLFFRGPDGSISEESSRQEFVVHPAAVSVRESPPAILPSVGESSVTIENAPGDLEAASPVEQVLTDQPLPPESGHGEARQFSRTRWVWRAATMISIAGTLLYWIANSTPAAGLSLRAFDLKGQLRIDWRCDDRAIRKSAYGTLEIEDGLSKVQNELTKDQLRAGSVTYARETGNVLVRLTIRREDDSTLTETARFLGSPVPKALLVANVAERMADVPLDNPHDDAGPAQQPVMREAEKPPQSSMKRTAQEQGKAEILPFTSAVVRKPTRSLVIPAAIPSRNVDLGPPPAATAAPKLLPALPDLVPRIPPPQPPGKPAYRGPTEGKIIWTGKLARHGTIRISGATVSEGYVNSALPGVPVSVQVLPAELSATGLRIFTADSKSAVEVEAPGVQNGWNRTSYVLNPVQAVTVRLIETPGPQNAWKGLTLRAERGEHSIIVLKWRLAANPDAQLAEMQERVPGSP